MPRIEPIDHEPADGPARELLDEHVLTGGFNLVAGIYPSTSARSAA